MKNDDILRTSPPERYSKARGLWLWLLVSAIFAIPVVAQSPPPGGETAQRFGDAPQRLVSAAAAGDKNAGLAAAKEIQEMVAVLGAETRWSDTEAQVILQAGRMLELVGRHAEAAKLAHRAASGTSGRRHLEAAAVAWQLARRAESAGAEGNEEDKGADGIGIRILAEAEAQLAADDPLYHGIQELVLTGLAASNDADRLHQQMVQAGIHPAVARLVELHQAERQWQARQFQELEETLQRVRPAVEAPRVAPVWAAWWTNLYGLLLQHQDRFVEATTAHHRAVQLATAAGRPELAGIAEENVALLALRMGDYARARRLLEKRSQAASAPMTPDRWAAEINLAKALEGDHDFVQARQRLQQLLQHDGTPVDRATAENNLALNLFMTGQWEAAEEHWEAASRILSEAFPEGHPYQAEVEINRGWLDKERGKPDSARDRFRCAIEQIRSERGSDDPRLVEAQAYLARLLAAAGQTEESRRLIEAALSARVDQLEKMVSALSPRDRLAVTQDLRVHAESSAWPGAFDTYLELAPQLEVPVEKQYAAVLRWKSLLERAADRFERAAEQIPPAIVERRETIRRELHDEYFRPVSRLLRGRHAERIAALEAELEDIERRRAELQASVTIAAAPEPAGVTGGLEPGELLVDFVQHRIYAPGEPGQMFAAKSSYLAFVSRRGGPVVRVDLPSSEAVDAAIAQWRSAIESSSPDAERAGRAVGQLLWQPLQAAVGEDGSRVRICPDAGLFQVPWAAIPLAEERLADRAVISIVPRVATAANADALDPGRPGQPRLLLVGGVDYGPLRSRWPLLPGTTTEIDAVAQAFSARFPDGQIERLEGMQATEAAVLRGLDQASHVHFATHGFYLRRGDADAFGLGGATAALNSGIVLAPPAADEQGRDQFLTSDELAELHRSERAPLWVLSACETGLGRPQAGQGMVGLLTALDRAGARGTVASLWKVDDEATSQLMAEFYRQLWEQDLAPQAALRAAQLKLRRGSDPQMAELKHWAAFYFSDGTRKYR